MEKMAWVRGEAGEPSTNGHSDMEVMAEEVRNGACGLLDQVGEWEVGEGQDVG